MLLFKVLEVERPMIERLVEVFLQLFIPLPLAVSSLTLSDLVVKLKAFI
jgi:hypothetical protein